MMKFYFYIAGFFIVSNVNAQLYTLKSFDDVKLMLQNNADTLTIVNFWATWCKPCIEELPYFEKINTEYAGQAVKVILISLDTEKQWAGSLVPFLEKNNIQSDVWVLPNKKPVDWIDQINPKWQGSIPATFMLNNKKGISIFEEHAFSYEELIVLLKQNNYLTN